MLRYVALNATSATSDVAFEISTQRGVKSSHVAFRCVSLRFVAFCNPQCLPEGNRRNFFCCVSLRFVAKRNKTQHPNGHGRKGSLFFLYVPRTWMLRFVAFRNTGVAFCCVLLR